MWFGPRLFIVAEQTAKQTLFAVASRYSFNLFFTEGSACILPFSCPRVKVNVTNELQAVA